MCSHLTFQLSRMGGQGLKESANADVRCKQAFGACSHRMTHVTLTGSTFDIFDGYCDGQNFARQRNRNRNGVARCEQAFNRLKTVAYSY